MKKCLKIGITGGIASGKSEVSSYLRRIGYVVFSCDEINASLWCDEEYLKKLQNLFPECVYEGKIDKNSLRKMIFASKEKRKILENIAHPLIIDKLFASMDEQTDTCFAEVPLLLECDLVDKFDKILVVMRGLEDRIGAIAQRDDCDNNLALKKIESQFPYDAALMEGFFSNEKFCLIFNYSSLDQLYTQVNDFLEKLH